MLGRCDNQRLIEDWCARSSRVVVGPRVREDDHPPRTVVAQDARALVRGRAGGHHIIKDAHRLTGKAWPRVVERPRDIRPPLAQVHAHLTVGVLRPQQPAGRLVSAQFSEDALRLIEATLPLPRAMQRDGEDNIGRVDFCQRGNGTRHDRRHALDAPVLQRMYHPPRRAFHINRGIHPFDRVHVQAPRAI